MSEKTSDSETPRKNGRIGKPKVKTGCITCKVRRIKCDEGKPFCARCSTTGRKCDGYAVQKKGESFQEGKLKGPLLPRFPPLSIVIKFKFGDSFSPRLLVYPDSTPEELRALEFFRCKTAYILSAWLAENFWKDQLPQAACYEPSIRHSMIAMATIHEDTDMFELRGTDLRFFTPSDARQQFTAQHVRLAMNDFNNLLATRPEATEIALMNCVLFSMLDFMVGNFATALLHLSNGQDIISRWVSARPMGQVPRVGSLEANLTQILRQLSFRVSEDYVDPLAYLEIDDQRLEPFVDLEIARRNMEYLTAEGLRIVRVQTVRALAKQESHESMRIGYEVDQQRGRLERWSIKFDSLAFAMSDITSAWEEDEVGELRNMHMSAIIWLELGITFEDPGNGLNLDAAVGSADALHTTRCSQEHKYLSAHFIFEDRLDRKHPSMCFVPTRHPRQVGRSQGIAFLVSLSSDFSLSENQPKLGEERMSADGRRVLEVELESTTNMIDLTFLPDVEGGLWEIRTSDTKSDEYPSQY